LQVLLSGGEQKRVSFATECLTDPMLLFCDEPTTGLDSYSAQRLITMMKEMTHRGKTILCTIHQPSPELIHMFHTIVLVAEGTIVYMGTASSAIHFFQE
jgi:ABC-type multidrug transport system ATPase subunit